MVRIILHILGLIAPGLAAAWVYKLWFSTPRYPEPKRELRWREQAVSEFVDVDGDKIAVYQWGPSSQAKVYLIHGWSGRASQLGAFVKPLNDAGFTVIGFDAVGHGSSTGKSANIFKITNCFHLISEKYGRPVSIIAHSFGCMVAALAIKKYQLASASLVTISSPTRPEYLVELFTGTLQITSKVIDIFNTKLKSEFGANVYHEISADENLRNNRLPALIVHDKDDLDVSWEYSQRLVAAMPNATAVYTQGLGHRRILRDKQVVAKIVAFISGEKNG